MSEKTPLRETLKTTRKEAHSGKKSKGSSFLKTNKLLRVSLCIAAGAACLLAGAAAYANTVQPLDSASEESASLYGRAVTAPQPTASSQSLGPMRDVPMTDTETGLPIVEDVEDASLLVEGDLAESGRVDESIFENDIFREASYAAEEPDADEETPLWKTMTFDKDVKQGDTGEVVGVIQSRLMELGYMEPGTPSGTFDEETATGVSRFQRNHEITPTGIADVPTLQIMMSDRATLYQMSFNQDGEDIQHLQERLNTLGYSVSVTGYFDKETEEQVVSFQKTNGLVEDGIVSLGTKAVLYSDAALDGKGTLSTVTANVTLGNVGVETLISSAMKQLGKTYVLGGKGPTTFDCSGLVYYCLNESGYQIGYMTSHQWKDSAFPTINSISDLQRGDIVCFNGHVGIYLGDGTMIDASSSEGKVRISGTLANSSYWTTNFICGKRVY